jgi:hypothetical protein
VEGSTQARKGYDLSQELYLCLGHKLNTMAPTGLSKAMAHINFGHKPHMAVNYMMKVKALELRVGYELDGIPKAPITT